MKSVKIKCDWDGEKGLGKATIRYHGNEYIGFAKCHPDDNDMKSEKVSYEIALSRAYVKALKEIVKESKLKLEALNHYYHSVKNSKKYTPGSYENKMLQKQIKMYQNDIVLIRMEIFKEEQDNLYYIQNKEKFYQKIRINRSKNNDI